MKLLAFAASLRKNSLNKKLIRVASFLAQKQGAEMDLAQFSEFDMPLYNGDIETGTGLPAGAIAFKERIEKADGLIISSPEYNFSIPGTLKNTIDWLSRIKPVPLENKWALLLSASPSMIGGNRGLLTLRVPLEALGVFVYPAMFGLAKAHKAFDENGNLKDPQLLERLEKIIQSFLKIIGLFFIIFFTNPAPALAKEPRIFEHLKQDTLEIFLKWPVAVIAGGAITAAALTQVDQSVQDSFRAGRHMGKADTFFRHLGAAYVIDSSALAAFGIGAISRSEEWIRTGETLLETLAFSESTTLGLKIAFDRQRPNGGGHGFPSGHASRAFALASALETLHGPLIGIPGYLLAGLISFSRLDENAHNLSDILFGGALGIACGWGSANFHKKETTHLLIIPTHPNGAGILLSRQF